MVLTSKFASAISIVTCVLTSVSAGQIPISEMATCRPNFEGNRETIYVQLPGAPFVDEWTPSGIFSEAVIELVRQSPSRAFATGEFLVPFSGDAAGTHQIKLVADTQRNLYLTAGASGHLYFAPGSGGIDPSQVWKIECNQCPPLGTGQTTGLRASGCTIFNPFTGQCITGSDAGLVLFLSKCYGDFSQQYSFISGK